MMDGFSRSVDRLRDVAGCLTHSRLIVRPAGARAGRTVLEFGSSAPVRAGGALRGSAIDLTLSLAGDGDIRAYTFAFLDPSGAELLAWHWHPAPLFPVPTFPHLHVSAGLRIVGAGGERGLLPLDKRHLPTGVVSLAAFARMLIEEFGVEPLALDWRDRLADA